MSLVSNWWDMVSGASNKAFRDLVVSAAGLQRTAAMDADSSFSGERAGIDALLAELGVSGGFCVDLGASDGVTMSCSLPLFASKEWEGLAVEMDPVKFAKLSMIYTSFEGARLARLRVVPSNVGDLLAGFDVPRNFEFLNLDIDSFDLDVVGALLLADYRPLLISMEINEKIPPPLMFKVRFSENHRWSGDHFFGCSLSAAEAVLSQFGYILAGLEYNNAFFVDGESADARVGGADGCRCLPGWLCGTA